MAERWQTPGDPLHDDFWNAVRRWHTSVVDSRGGEAAVAAVESAVSNIVGAERRRSDQRAADYRALLRVLEWHGPNDTCPACASREGKEHLDSCDLAAALAGPPSKAPKAAPETAVVLSFRALVESLAVLTPSAKVPRCTVHLEPMWPSDASPNVADLDLDIGKLALVCSIEEARLIGARLLSPVEVTVRIAL